MNNTIRPINEGRDFEVKGFSGCDYYDCKERNFDCEVNPNYVAVCPRKLEIKTGALI